MIVMLLMLQLQLSKGYLTGGQMTMQLLNQLSQTYRQRETM